MQQLEGEAQVQLVNELEQVQQEHELGQVHQGLLPQHEVYQVQMTKEKQGLQVTYRVKK